MAYSRAGAFSALGQGLRGIGHTVADLRREEEQREIEEEERRRTHEYQDFQTEMGLIERGGAMAPAPTVESEVPGTGAPRPEFEAPEFIPEPDEGPLSAEAMMGPIEFETREPTPLTRSEDHPDFMSVGPEGEWHIERPDSREARLEEDRLGRFRDRVAPAVEGLASGQVTPQTEGFGESYADLAGQGLDPSGIMPEPIGGLPTNPQVELGEWARDHGVSPRDFLGAYPPAPRSSGQGSSGTTLSSGVIQDWMDDNFGVYERDEQGQEVLTGYMLSPDQQIKVAHAAATNQNIDEVLPPDVLMAVDLRRFDPEVRLQRLRAIDLTDDQIRSVLRHLPDSHDTLRSLGQQGQARGVTW